MIEFAREVVNTKSLTTERPHLRPPAKDSLYQLLCCARTRFLCFEGKLLRCRHLGEEKINGDLPYGRLQTALQDSYFLGNVAGQATTRFGSRGTPNYMDPNYLHHKHGAAIGLSLPVSFK